jgi:hypothetical protein
MQLHVQPEEQSIGRKLFVFAGRGSKPRPAYAHVDNPGVHHG